MSTQSAPGIERDSAAIVVLQIDASRSQFVLFSARGRLLLRSGPIANGSIAEAIDEWRARLSAAGAFYEAIQTDQPFGVPLRRAFAARQRLS